MTKHYLTELDVTPEATWDLVQEAIRLKAERARNERRDVLAGKHIALYFEKPSVRTRVSFTVGVQELGGQVVELAASNTKLGRGEEVSDFSRVMGRYVHGLVARVFDQRRLETMATHAGIPVVNALSDARHPCQALADVQTIVERKGRIEGVKFGFVGDGNNVAASTGLLCAALGADVTVASPEGFELPEAIQAQGKDLAGRFRQVEDVDEAVVGADVLYTDTWVSMGQEEERMERLAKFRAYTIDTDVLRKAAPDCSVMHCLPAVVGDEIAADVMYGTQSAIWDQAENRLHAQKALLCSLFSE